MHATNKWSDENVELDTAAVEQQLADELQRIAGIDAGLAETRQLHRWLYANADRRHGEECFVDEDNKLAACGDWFIRGRVEAAFKSASALSARLHETLGG